MSWTTNMTRPGMPTAGSVRLSDNEDSWFSLIERLRAHAVIPVIGPELLDVRVQSSDGTIKTGSFYRIVSESLCAHYGIPPPSEEGGHAWCLHAAVSAVIANKENSVEKIRRTTARIVNSLCQNTIQFPALSVLSTIDPFDVFVSLTCDDLLGRAVAPAQMAMFSPRTATALGVDIPPPRPKQRVVFQIFGAASSLTDFAIHEEDALEYLFVLQSEGSRRLPIALSELRRRDLLLIGCNLPDWMGRSLLRLARDDRLFVKSTQEFFSDDVADPSLTAFFSRFSPNTMSFEGEARSFVNELARRWSTVAQRTIPPIAPSETSTQDSLGPTAFVSYASENSQAALQVATTLIELGFSDVWLDQKKLIAGDDWSHRIDDAITGCDFFLPLLSREADQRRRGVFWEEWRKALDQAEQIHGEFIIPVGIDEDKPSQMGYLRINRDEFKAFFGKHLIHAPRGEFDEQGKNELRQRAKQFKKIGKS